jgi:hypothetical protein
MAAIKAVRAATPDSKAGKPKGRSGVEFPYYDLDSSIAVAKTIHDRSGGICDRAALAGYLNYSSQTNGSFLTRVAAARMFGLIEPGDSGQLKVTDRGRAIIAPISQADVDRAKIEAFMGIELFRKVYEQYNGSVLPEAAGLKNLIETQHGVVKARVAPTVRIMLDSADQAGFFKAAGSKRMIKPHAGSGTTAPPASTPASDAEKRDEVRRQGSGGGGGGGSNGSDKIHPAFIGLLSGLPEPGSRLTDKRRKALADAFTNIVNVVYPEDDQIGN